MPLAALYQHLFGVIQCSSTILHSVCASTASLALIVVQILLRNKEGKRDVQASNRKWKQDQRYTCFDRGLDLCLEHNSLSQSVSNLSILVLALVKIALSVYGHCVIPSFFIKIISLH